MSLTLVAKISAKDLLGPVAKVVKENITVGERKDVFGVAGMCDAIEEGTGTYGEWARFKGEFQAVNYLTAEVFRSEATHVPSVLESVLLRDLQSMRDTVKELKHSTVTALTGPIEFAFTVAIERLEDEDNGAISYKYICTPKTELKQNDKISHLTKMLELSPPENTKTKK